MRSCTMGNYVLMLITSFLIVLLITEAFSEEKGKSCGTVKGVRNRRRHLISFAHDKKLSLSRVCGRRRRPLKGLPSSVICMYGKWYNQGKAYDLNAIIGKARYPCERIYCLVPKSWSDKFGGLASKYSPGTSLKFVCPKMHRESKLFKQLGGRLRCLSGGKWNIGNLPLGTLCEAITCKWPPPSRPKVRFTYPDKRKRFNLQAVYICAKYHGILKPNGRWSYNLKVACDHNTGKWQEIGLQCQPLKCRAPPQDLGKATTTSNSSVATVRCKSPFIYSDGKTAEQTYPCKWDHRGYVGFHIPQDACLKCRGFPKISKHTTYKLMSMDTRMDYKCEPGYEFYDGREKRIALCTVYKGKEGWIPKELVPCQAAIPNCGKNTMPTVNHAIGEKNKQVGTYTCEKGYTFPRYGRVKKVSCDPKKGWPSVSSCVKEDPSVQATKAAPTTPNTDEEDAYNYF